MTAATWGVGVLEASDGDRWAWVGVQPDEAALHADMVVRFKAAGLKRVTRYEWNAGLWPLSRCSVTFEQGHVTQLHTGRSRIQAATALPVTEGWSAAAERGRVVLLLLQAGSFPWVPSTAASPPEEGGKLLEKAVEMRAVMAGLADLRDTPEPYGRRW